RFNYDRLFGADNATLAVSGRFESNTGYRAVRRFFGNWLKSDETIPATFKQPGDPPTEPMIKESPSAERSEVRYAIRGVSRGSKEYAAAEILTRIYEARLKAKAPAERQEKVFVRNEARFLPGLIIFGFSDGRADAAGFKKAMMEALVTDAEFNAHRSAAASNRNSTDGVTQWLDADTYRLASVKADADALSSVTLSDVRALAERLKSTPMVTVAIIPPAAPEPPPAPDNSDPELE
ncbi:MAG TPA: insulinase family protein, partial [Pyrinomonadaceae bacterium]|nr:insulinase family protein [Pyrinomonadaceae bacterium]